MNPGDFGEGCVQHENTQPLTLLPRSWQANPGFEGGQGGPGLRGLSRGVQGASRGGSMGGRGLGRVQGVPGQVQGGNG